MAAEGILSPKTDAERNLPENYRLACSTYALGDAVISVERQDEILGVSDIRLPDDKHDVKKGFGTVVDIGTTTVAAYIFNLENGKCVSSLCLPNPQRQYGADVISRIEYVRSFGVADMKTAIRKTVGEMQNSFGQEISESVILGNTAMMHFYEGISTDSMATAPFTPSDLFGRQSGKTYFPRCISAFIGADAVSAVIAAGLDEKSTALLLDIGTNCETVLWHKGEVYCCSSAAGPAFEGSGISCGVPSIKGAINKVFVINGEIGYTTIGNEPPCGVCGSGLIDAVSCMLDMGVLDSTGYIENDFPIGDSGYVFTQKDIRQLQLAKAAVRAGVETLLAEVKIDFADVEKVYLAGGFGSKINVGSCERIGLLPEGASKKATALGNAAAAGGAYMLLNAAARNKAEEIAKKANALSLADDKFFADAFVMNMSFDYLV